MTIDENAVRAAIRNEIRRKARKNMKARMGLVWHAAVFAMSNAALYAINQAYTPQHLWFVWPLAAWGAGLLMHVLATISSSGRDQRIEEEVEREMGRRGMPGT